MGPSELLAPDCLDIQRETRRFYEGDGRYGVEP